MIRGFFGSFDNLYPVVDPPPAWLLDGFSDSNIFLLWCRILYCHRGPFFCEFIPRYYANAKCSVTPFALLSASSTNELLHHFINGSYPKEQFILRTWVSHYLLYFLLCGTSNIFFSVFLFSFFFSPITHWKWLQIESGFIKWMPPLTKKLTLGSQKSLHWVLKI